MIEQSWNLGLWRGAMKCKRAVALAPAIDRPTYLAGYARGADERATRDAERRALRNPTGPQAARRPSRPAPTGMRRAA